jgi:hypothetical protein
MAQPVSAILRTIERAVASVAEREEQEDGNDGKRKEKDQGEVH